MINLLPSEAKQNVAYAKRNRVLVHFGSYLICLFLIIGSIYTFSYLMLNQRHKLAQSDFDVRSSAITNSKIEAQAQKLSDSIATASTLLKREKRFSVLIKQIGTLLPIGARLSTLSLTNDPTQPLQIDAIVSSPDQALVLKRNIEEKLDVDDKKLFTGADVLSIGSSKVKDASGNETIIFTAKFSTAFNDKSLNSGAVKATTP